MRRAPSKRRGNSPKQMVGNGSTVRIYVLTVYLETEMETRTEHKLKTWPCYFVAIWDGLKRYEVRRDDRGFRPADTLLLQEYEPTRRHYTGREIRATVGYMMCAAGMGLLQEDAVVMQLEDIERIHKETER